VLTTPDLVDDVPLEVGVAVSDDPTRAFYELHNALLRHTAFYGERPATSVDATAVVEHGAHLDPTGVVVGAGCHIHAGAVVRGPAVLGRRVVIESGAVIGAAGFQTSSRSGDAVDLHHAGGVHIGDDVHVHANAVVAAGPFDLPTQIGAHTQIGNGAFVSHRCRLGQHVYVGHLAALNGRVEVGDGAWIGPGAVVAHRLRLGAGCAVALGSTVVDDVEPGAKVSGLPAGDQHTMFRHAVAIRRSPR
jgi:UDP-3-O-[3-hydroxymyristoyl] glucosamine N-acyltransferase